MTETSIPVLYESTGLIVVNKPEGLASIPERDGKETDVFSLLQKQTGMKLFVVHRLDKGVTGVLVYAKNAETHKFLNDQFADRKTKKRYMAIVHGKVKAEEGTIDAPIRQFGSGRMGVDAVKGVACTTRYKIVETFTRHTLLGVNPLTGRRHQIRVHLYSIGHPVVGDPLYGEPRIQKPFPHLALHARELEIEEEPGKLLTLEAKLPPSFSETLEQVRALKS